jgi:hypothetical protein
MGTLLTLTGSEWTRCWPVRSSLHSRIFAYMPFRVHLALQVCQRCSPFYCQYVTLADCRSTILVTVIPAHEKFPKPASFLPLDSASGMAMMGLGTTRVRDYLQRSTCIDDTKIGFDKNPIRWPHSRHCKRVLRATPKPLTRQDQWRLA